MGDARVYQSAQPGAVGPGVLTSPRMVAVPVEVSMPALPRPLSPMTVGHASPLRAQVRCVRGEGRR